MFSELGKAELGNLGPLLRSVPRDPMLDMVLEGNRQGRIFADRPSSPGAALIWTGMEYAYLIGEPAGHRAEVVHVVEQVILPTLEKAGLDFVTIFPHGASPAAVQAWFPERQPVSFGVNSFTFELDRYERLCLGAEPLPPGYGRVRDDQAFAIQAGGSEAYQRAALVWRQAGDRTRRRCTGKRPLAPSSRVQGGAPVAAELRAHPVRVRLACCDGRVLSEAIRQGDG
jgi:hypothetical protein